MLDPIKHYDSLCLIKFSIFIMHISVSLWMAQGPKATIHQLTTMLSTSKNVQFSGHNHLLTTSTDIVQHIIIIVRALARVMIKVNGH